MLFFAAITLEDVSGEGTVAYPADTAFIWEILPPRVTRKTTIFRSDASRIQAIHCVPAPE